jgi:hypothetical protein
MNADDWDEATNEEGDTEEEDDVDEENGIAPDGYGVRRTRRRTNWQHRADALRPAHIRQLRELEAAARNLLFNAAEYAIFGCTMRAYIRGMVLNQSLINHSSIVGAIAVTVRSESPKPDTRHVGA